MSEERMLDTMREIDFLRGIAPEHLKRLAEVARLVEFPEGTTIFREGDPASLLFVVVAGNVSLEICGPGKGCTCLHTVRDGELFGWSSVLRQPRFTATARALTITQAIELNGAKTLALCEHDSSFGYEFMRRIALAIGKRLQTTRMQLLDTFGKEMPSVRDERD